MKKNTVENVETWIVAVCQELLGVDQVDPGADFFELGGTSLTAIRLIARVDAHFGEEVLLPDDLFADARPAAWARVIENKLKVSEGAPQLRHTGAA